MAVKLIAAGSLESTRTHFSSNIKIREIWFGTHRLACEKGDKQILDGVELSRVMTGPRGRRGRVEWAVEAVGEERVGHRRHDDQPVQAGGTEGEAAGDQLVAHESRRLRLHQHVVFTRHSQFGLQRVQQLEKRVESSEVASERVSTQHCVSISVRYMELLNCTLYCAQLHFCGEQCGVHHPNQPINMRFELKRAVRATLCIRMYCKFLLKHAECSNRS